MIVRTSTLLALGSALALVACAPPAPAPQPVGVAASLPPRERLVSAIEAEGCVFSRETSGAVLLRANMTQAEASAIFGQLYGEGLLEAGGTEGAETVRLLSNNCI